MEAESAPRRQVATLVTDIVGYAALMAGDEERGLRVRERIVDIVRACVAEHGGGLAQVGVDETLSTFPTALGAVSCGRHSGAPARRVAAGRAGSESSRGIPARRTRSSRRPG